MKLDNLKSLSLAACESLAQIPSENTHLGRQQRCADFLHYAIAPESLKMALNRANFCKQRTCPVCTWLKTTKWRIRFFQGLPRLLARFPNHLWLFLTLTIRNCHFKDLRSHIRLMEKGWNRLSDLQCFPAIGYLKSLEVTRPRDCFYAGHFIGRMGATFSKRWVAALKGTSSWNPQLWREYFCEEAHPHFHCLMMVPSSYFRSGGFIHSEEWRSLWRRSARLDYAPIVDIRKVDKLGSAVLEASKYCLKPSDMVDVMGCLTIRQLHSLKLLSVGGCFKDYFSQAALDAIAESGELGTEHWQDGVPCWYQWDGEEYSMVRLGDTQWEAPIRAY